ncbi:conserved hypothetical protein [Frankia canadensis]|uniref:DUF6286 domain-containing protein n=1 Tax=Frankia canadensis TaxID=1836972 RepID=A0A2I2L111_9ACTN|nr:DUF6286 domain-containing protein [Frankia canadensis]SNQ51604.1 conserved hypothetical protein [Frankia canadensis]SOU58894.1 conserved hypothetical protein [Frankia canadensis]
MGEKVVRAGQRLAAWVLAGLIAAAGIIAVIEIVTAAAGAGYVIVDWPSWAGTLGRTAWSARSARVGAAVAVLLGLSLVGLALLRGTPDRLPARWSRPRAGVYVDRRGLARALRASALDVDGVDGARVRVGRSTAQARLRLRERAAGGAAQRATAALQRELDAFGLVHPPSLMVRVDGRPGRDSPTRAGQDRPAGDGPSAGWRGPVGYGGPPAGAGRADPDGRDGSASGGWEASPSGRRDASPAGRRGSPGATGGRS